MKKSLASFLSLLLITMSVNGASIMRPRVTMRVSLSGSVSPLQPDCVSPPLIGETSPHMAVDPKDSKHIAVVYSLGDLYFEAPRHAPVVATSYDGGGTWTRTPLGGLTPCTGGENGAVFDPFIAIGADGHVAATNSWISWDPLPSTEHSDARLFVSRSADGGATFQSPVEPQHTGNPVANQRGIPLFDSQSPNRLLVAFEQTHYMNQGPAPSPTGDYILGVGGSVDVARSEDAGATFSWVSTALAVPPGQEAVTIGLLGSGTDVIVVAAVVNDADFFSSLATGSPVPQYLYSMRSTDGGSTFGSPHPIGIYNGGPLRLPGIGLLSPPPQNAGAASGANMPSAAAGPDGTLYVTWTDAGTKSVMLARSTDGGNSWTAAPAVTTTDGALESAVAVRSNGNVGLFYYAITPDLTRPNDMVITPYMAVSKDGVSGWTTVPLDNAFDVSRIWGGSSDGAAMGPFQDIAAVQGGFGASVTLSDDQGEEHVWFIKVSL